jgi:general secretion pathway protein J
VRRAPSAGFTLVEVLIAVGIFALIGIVAAALLTRTLEARAEAAARADRLQALQRGMQRLERDVLQYAGRAVRDEFGDPQAPLVLDLTGALELTVQGWRNPLSLPRSELQRVRWRLTEDGTLERAFWTVLDRAQDSGSRAQAVISDVRAFDVEVVDGEGSSWRDWPRDGGPGPSDPLALPGDTGTDPEATGGSAYPIALRLALDVPPLGRVERLLLVGEAIELRADEIQAPAQEPASDEEPGEAVPDA